MTDETLYSEWFDELCAYLGREVGATEPEARAFLKEHGEHVWEISSSTGRGVTKSYPRALKKYWLEIHP